MGFILSNTLPTSLLQQLLKYFCFVVKANIWVMKNADKIYEYFILRYGNFGKWVTYLF